MWIQQNVYDEYGQIAGTQPAWLPTATWYSPNDPIFTNMRGTPQNPGDGYARNPRTGRYELVFATYGPDELTASGGAGGQVETGRYFASDGDLPLDAQSLAGYAPGFYSHDEFDWLEVAVLGGLTAITGGIAAPVVGGLGAGAIAGATTGYVSSSGDLDAAVKGAVIGGAIGGAADYVGGVISGPDNLDTLTTQAGQGLEGAGELSEVEPLMTLGEQTTLAGQGLEGAGELSEVEPLTTLGEQTTTLANQALEGAGEITVLPAAPDAPLVDTAATFAPPLPDLTVPEVPIPELAPEDLQAIQAAAAPAPLPEPAPAPEAPDAPLVSQNTITPEAPPELPVPELVAPEVPELPLPEITVAAGGGAALGTLALPALSTLGSSLKNLLSSSGPATPTGRAAITPDDLTLLRPDDTGTVSTNQFALVGTVLLALASVFFIK